MKIEIKNPSQGSLAVVRGECPHCSYKVTFDKTPIGDLHASNHILGVRACPSVGCRGHVFFIAQRDNQIVQLFPPAKIHFDSKNVPDEVRESLEEAFSCYIHENYRAAAVMIRRSLELICADQNAHGKDLRDRIESLKSQVILPPKLFEGMHNLRMLGNDAVHIEAKTYEEIGKPQAEAGVKFAKRLIESVYQTEDLVQELENLKKK